MPKVLDLVIAPNKILLTSCEDIKLIDNDLLELIENMILTMNRFRGIGLAANQVGVAKKITVIDFTAISKIENHQFYNNINNTNHLYKDGMLIMINPLVVQKSTTQDHYLEGCLSFPGATLSIPRSTDVVVQYINIKGNEQTLDLPRSLLNVCIQHEIDHLNGIPFTNYVSPLKKDITMKKVAKTYKNMQHKVSY